MRRLATLLFLLTCLGVHGASTRITTIITITNVPVATNTLTYNTTTRTWTNNISSSPSTLIAVTNSIGASTTNLFRHIAAYALPSPSGPNTLRPLTNNTKVIIVGDINAAVTASQTGNWCDITFITNSAESLTIVRVPIGAEPTASVRTNIASLLVQGISDHSTSAIVGSSISLSNFMALNGRNEQTVTNVTIFGTNAFAAYTAEITTAEISNLTLAAGTLSGNVLLFTNGTYWSPILTNATLYSATSRGAPLRSIGTGSHENSDQFGSQADARQDGAVAINDADVWAIQAIGIGNRVFIPSNALAAVAIANKAEALDEYAIAIGSSSNADKTNTISIGHGAHAAHYQSTTWGLDSSSTADQQMRWGSTTLASSFPGKASFGSLIAVGSDWHLDWPQALTTGLILVNGASAQADATNGAAIWANGGNLFYRGGTNSEAVDKTYMLHNRAQEVTGTGTDYNLTTEYVRVDFEGQDPEITLPTAGTYQLNALVEVNMGDTAYDRVFVKFRNSTDGNDITDSERVTGVIPNDRAGQVILQNIITVTASKVIQIYAYNEFAARGYVKASRTTLNYVRLY